MRIVVMKKYENFAKKFCAFYIDLHIIYYLSCVQDAGGSTQKWSYCKQFLPKFHKNLYQSSLITHKAK